MSLFKKIFFIILINFLVSNIALAACPTSGLVPCGTEDCPCTLCHIFVLIKRVIDFLITHIAIPLVAIMAFVSAIFFITAHGDPQWIKRARDTITAAVIGFIIVLGSWVIVNTIVVFATGNSAGEVFGKPWYTIQCGSSGGGGTPQLPGQNTTGENLDPQEVAMAENMQEAEAKGNYEVYGVDSGRNKSSISTSKRSLDSLVASIFGWGKSIYRTTPVLYYPDPQFVNYPTNLGIQNARFGSRFNLNFHFDPARKKCWSSTMGSQMDASTSFIIATRLEDGSIYRFPPSNQYYPEIATLIEVLPDRQRIYGYHPKNGQPTILTSVATISPFSPFKELNDEDENFKLSIAPFFYHEIALYNNNYNNSNLNDDEIKGSLLVTFDYFHSYEEIDYEGKGKIKIIYFKIPETIDNQPADQDRDGIRALAIWDPLNLVSFGYGDGIFDYFKNNGRLPCKSASGEDFSKCKVGGSRWNAGGFAIDFNFEKKDKYGNNLPEEEKEKAIVFIYAGYNGGTVMKDENGGEYKFYYTKLFGDEKDENEKDQNKEKEQSSAEQEPKKLSPEEIAKNGVKEVITYAVNRFDFIIQKTTEFSNNIRGGDGRPLNPHAQWILSQALHSYFANTWLVYNKNNKEDVRYYVSEGGCDYLSTLDVAHETAIFEAEYIPWALKKQLSEWKKYIKFDKKNPPDRGYYGAFLSHDMGMYPIQSPHSSQSREDAIFNDQAYIMYNQFGAMPLEENLNFILIAYRYWKKTGDIDFIRNLTCNNQNNQKVPCIELLLDYIETRDKEDNIKDGVFLSDHNVTVDLKSARVKQTLGGQNTVQAKGRTTFDCCGKDFALSLEKGNVYLTIKTFAALIAAREMELALGRKQKARYYLDYAKIIKGKLDEIYKTYSAPYEGEQRNFFILSLDKSKIGWGAASIAVFDGLTYLTLDPPSHDEGLFSDFVKNYIKPIKGPFLFAWIKCTATYAYRLALPDVNRPDFKYCVWGSTQQEACFDITWLSKTFNTNTILKYAKPEVWEVFTNDSYVKAKNLLQRSSMGYQDAWEVNNGTAAGLWLYPRGVSVLGQKLIK